MAECTEQAQPHAPARCSATQRPAVLQGGNIGLKSRAPTACRCNDSEEGPVPQVLRSADTALALAHASWSGADGLGGGQSSFPVGPGPDPLQGLPQIWPLQLINE